MKIFHAPLFLLLSCTTVTGADTTLLRDTIAAHIDTYGEKDFAPSEIRELYLTNQTGKGFAISHDSESLEVITSIDGCGRFDAPLTVFSKDTNGDLKVDHFYTSLQQWKCESDTSYVSILSNATAQMMFDQGVVLVEIDITKRASK